MFMMAFFMSARLLREGLKLFPKRSHVCTFCSHSQSPDNHLDLQKIKADLTKFSGGSVDLSMDNDTGIAVMMLNNPKKRNSLTGQMIVNLTDRVTELEQWTNGKGLILCGIGGNFCSGGDLTFVSKALHLGREMATLMHDTTTRLHNLPLISVALIQGHAVGGGSELATCCDFRVMSPTAKVGFVQLKMGVTTGWGATTRLMQLLGRRSTIRLLTSAKVMNPQEAETEGLVDFLLPSGLNAEEELAECKRWLLGNYCHCDVGLVRTVKSAVVMCDQSGDIDMSLRHERDSFATVWGGESHRAALEANKRHTKR